MEGLEPYAKCETTPGTNTIASSFPEENGDCAPGDSSYGAGKNEHATKGLRWRFDGGQNTITNYENGAYEGKRVEADEEK